MRKYALGVAIVLTALSTYAETVQQPVFLLCPHKERYSAWSLFLTVDKSDPSKVLGLGLEKLNHQNSKDSSYEEVLAKQREPKTERETLGTLEAKEFETGQIQIKRDDALKVSVKKILGGYRLNVDMRIGSDKHFLIGGKEQSKRDVILRYDEKAKTWTACAMTLLDNTGKKLVESGCKPMTGLVFPVVGTGIYKIAGILEGNAVVLMDRE